ncbi:MAG: hypothetical protein ABDH49_05505 [Candidatus Hydrothermales bacterium]
MLIFKEKIYLLSKCKIYKHAEPIVLKVFEKLGIDGDMPFESPKSGNLRDIIWLKFLDSGEEGGFE